MAAIELTIPTGRREGQVFIPSSKSMAHRYLIAAALGSEPGKQLSVGVF